LHRRRSRRAAAEIRERGLAHLLERRDPAALEQDAADLMFVYRAIMARKASRAIELGSGQSTLFIAQAMHDQGFGHLWSLDADVRWLEHSRGMLPAALRPFVTFVHSPATVSRRFGFPAWEYSVLPEGRWDFILIDGPTLTKEVRLSCDLIKLAPMLSTCGVGMIDHRWRTAILAKEIAGALLRLRFVPSLESFVFEKATAKLHGRTLPV
jgi:predicted O-methyltransferase YrrM